jgi:hypothetical protein
MVDGPDLNHDFNSCVKYIICKLIPANNLSILLKVDGLVYNK